MDIRTVCGAILPCRLCNQGLFVGDTIGFVEKIIKAREGFPPFVRRSWDTIRRTIEEEEQTKLGDFLK